MIKTDILVIGATFYAAGLAQKKKIFVLESSYSFASDFASCMKACTVNKADAVSDAGRKLYDSMKSKKIIDDNGNIHVFSLPVICSELLENSEVLLGTSVTELKKCSDGYIISALNTDGRFDIQASQVIDTTALGYSSSPEGIRLSVNSPVKKYICATLVRTGDAAEIYGYKNGDVSVIKGALEDEYILKLALAPDASYTQARKALADAWHKAKDFAGWKLAAVASEFWYDYTEPAVKKRANCYFAPSASFENPIRSFEGGAECFCHI